MQNNYKAVTSLNVSLKFDDQVISVGNSAIRNNVVYFEYDSNFIKLGLEISPLKLPIQNGLQSFNSSVFEGIAGVFNDSLPDGWGRLLLDRNLRKNGINPETFSVLDRLAHVGENTMGALIYKPDYSENAKDGFINLDDLSDKSNEILETDTSEFFEELLALNGSSCGARPKALIGINKEKTLIINGAKDLKDNFEHWLVKFTNSFDGKDAGAIEYVYSQIARLAGVEIMDTHLFSSKKGAGYFATKRFDRIDNKRLHLHTACGLLHSDFRVPTLDYEDLIKLTSVLIKDAREVKKMFRLAVFNVLSNNRDDHSKNFSFLMDKQGQWKMSPAYDLTFSHGPKGEHSTMLMGEGKNPTIEHLILLSKVADINEVEAKNIIDQTRDVLSKWKNLAENAGVSKAKISEIGKIINY